MEKVEKYREFLADITEQHPNKSFFESVLTAYNILFEADTGISIADTDQADQLSDSLKKSPKLNQSEQSAIFTKFVGLDLGNVYPNQTLTMVLNTLERMIIGEADAKDMIKYIDDLESI